MTKSNRIEEVDISKGIGMVLVITGHLCVGAPLRNFIYSFHENSRGQTPMWST